MSVGCWIENFRRVLIVAVVIWGIPLAASGASTDAHQPEVKPLDAVTVRALPNKSTADQTKVSEKKLTDDEKSDSRNPQAVEEKTGKAESQKGTSQSSESNKKQTGVSRTTRPPGIPPPIKSRNTQKPSTASSVKSVPGNAAPPVPTTKQSGTFPNQPALPADTKFQNLQSQNNPVRILPAQTATPAKAGADAAADQQKKAAESKAASTILEQEPKEATPKSEAVKQAVSQAAAPVEAVSGSTNTGAGETGKKSDTKAAAKSTDADQKERLAAVAQSPVTSGRG